MDEVFVGWSLRELDLEIRAGDYLPLDTKSANFDNIADVQLLSPTLMNAGRPLGQLSACFVLPVDDALVGGRRIDFDLVLGGLVRLRKGVARKNNTQSDNQEAMPDGPHSYRLHNTGFFPISSYLPRFGP